MKLRVEEPSELDYYAEAALIADQLWKDAGGPGSIGAKLWAELFKKAHAPHLDTPRDYFISSFVKWVMNPNQYEKKHQRETHIFKQLMHEFEAAQEPVIDYRSMME